MYGKLRKAARVSKASVFAVIFQFFGILCACVHITVMKSL